MSTALHRAAINTDNAARPHMPRRNAKIIVYAALHPDRSYSDIAHHFTVTRNVVAGILGRAKQRSRR